MELKPFMSKMMVLVASLYALNATHAAEAPYPTKNVTIIMPYPAGGSS